MRKLFYLVLILTLTFINLNSAKAQTSDDNNSAIEKTRKIINEIINKSYPEINLKKVKVKLFQSDTNFFKARFSLTRFITFQKMRHIVYVNPKVFKLNASESAIHAILAHELAHVLYYTEKNRLELLGLAKLSSGSFTTKFERKADLQAIKRGYGIGLIEYRKWLYNNIPIKEIESKKKNYFSPEEVALILEITKDKPEMFEVWRRKVPKNIDEIKKSIE